MNFENNNFGNEKDYISENMDVFAQYIFNLEINKRYEEILNTIPVFLNKDEYNPLDIDVILEMKKRFLETCKLENREDFLFEFNNILQPIFDLKKKNIAAFEKALRKNTTSRRGFTELNDLLSYGKSGSEIHIHIFFNETLSVSEKVKMIEVGFGKLADIVDMDEEVKEITATSAIVAEHPKILEKYGFIIDGPISKDERGKRFIYDNTKIDRAHISREEFLRRYKK